MRDHKSKLQLFLLIRYINSSNAAAWKDPKATLIQQFKDPAVRKQLNIGKQDGLYVTVSEGDSPVPSDDISQTVAHEMWYSTQTHLKFFEAGEQQDPNSSFAGIADLYGHIVCLAEDLIRDPAAVNLPY